jgi:hypothetical protein
VKEEDENEEMVTRKRGLDLVAALVSALLIPGAIPASAGDPSATIVIPEVTAAQGAIVWFPSG